MANSHQEYDSGSESDGVPTLKSTEAGGQKMG